MNRILTGIITLVVDTAWGLRLPFTKMRWTYKWCYCTISTRSVVGLGMNAWDQSRFTIRVPLYYSVPCVLSLSLFLLTN
ncbi:hypothetical protein HOY80DRAFT_992786 [Tuber brumale]|nr:hypothetical protein HOY80DRAFT_992786 [Tuber brumale]